ncbi:Retrovirus-related Pol polyprotein from transposon RE1 [Cardamine amara subsp. amara]|uniref:Retrovirus-related Pol polyprotein from transposon RE1 n=1 Tax=Cardamine amara subsp. amara TaxID=228776 RepID=A0ABD1BEL9_CARAN
MVSIYVDDLIFCGNDEMLLEEFKESMKQEFEMTDLGLMRFFLGVEVRQSPDGIHLCQKKYAQEVLERFKMADCNPVKNPIVPGTKLTKEGEEEEVDSTLFNSVVSERIPSEIADK